MNSFKRVFALSLSGLLILSSLVGCGQKENSSSASVNASSTPQSSSIQASGSASQSSIGQQDTTASAQEIAGPIITAANLGATISIMEMDLSAVYGLSKDLIKNFYGESSKLASQNGGAVLVLVCDKANSAVLVSELETYRDDIAGDDRYAEFEAARENVANASISVKEVGEEAVIVYAVAAEGDFAALDEAIG